MPANPPGLLADHIDINDEALCAAWAKKLDTTTMQIHDAVAEVGNKAADVEMHLKGTHSTTNADQVQKAAGKTAF